MKGNETIKFRIEQAQPLKFNDNMFNDINNTNIAGAAITHKQNQFILDCHLLPKLGWIKGVLVKWF